MKIPTVDGLIRRRVLANYRASPEIVARLLPLGMRPKLQGSFAMVGVCLIRLENVRPRGLPALVGISSENAAHRFAVEWTVADGSRREGVYVRRRDSDSLLNQMAGGRIFPGEHHAARFVVQDDGARVSISMTANDGLDHVSLEARPGTALPPGSCFESLQQSSAFYAAGSLGYSATSDPTRFDGLILETPQWSVAPLDMVSIRSSFFDDTAHFPRGSIEFDHALVMRNVPHSWRAAEDYEAL